MQKPHFSVLILYWQSERFLADCLASLNAQSFTDFEVLLLDNGSTTPPDAQVLARYPDLHLQVLHSPTNLGFAGGNNFAARQAQGKYLAMLNSDAFPEPDWLENIHTASLNNPALFFASCLINAQDPTRLDGEWNVYHVSGMAWRAHQNQPLSSAEGQARQVLSACGAASVYPREAFEQIGGFDEDLFAYMEDIDLDLRLQAQGYQCLYLPEARVHHVGSGSTATRSDTAIYYGQRNLIWVFLKNMPGVSLWLFLPAHLFINLLYVLASFFVPYGKALRRAKLDALRQIPQTFAKRQAVQKARKISSWQLLARMNWNPFAPLRKLRTPAHKEQQ